MLQTLHQSILLGCAQQLEDALDDMLTYGRCKQTLLDCPKYQVLTSDYYYIELLTNKAAVCSTTAIHNTFQGRFHTMQLFAWGQSNDIYNAVSQSPVAQLFSSYILRQYDSLNIAHQNSIDVATGDQEAPLTYFSPESIIFRANDYEDDDAMFELFRGCAKELREVAQSHV